MPSTKRSATNTPEQGSKKAKAEVGTPSVDAKAHAHELSVKAFKKLNPGKDNRVNKDAVIAQLRGLGIRDDNPRAKPAFDLLDSFPGETIDVKQYEQLRTSDLYLARALDNALVFPRFDLFTRDLMEVYKSVAHDESGKPADYIPQLARVDPKYWGISACSVDGQQFKHGDADIRFCVQSVSKAITYALCIDELGEEAVHKHVGREPSGVGFNERVLNPDGLPHNPCINSGAIMCASLLRRDLNVADRFDYVMDYWKRLAGGGQVTFANSTYLSERATADRNVCLAYMMKEENVYPEGIDLHECLDFYFMCCSIELTCDQLAIVAATFANGGVCPITGDRVLSESAVRSATSIVGSCGMYDYSGAFCFDIGIPVKSGVGGGLLIIVPGKTGMATFSPRLDSWGNSARGVHFCTDMVSKFNFHLYDVAVTDVVAEGEENKQVAVLDPTDASAYHDEEAVREKELKEETLSLLYAAAAGDMQLLRSLSARGAVIDAADYDGRTAIHLSASEGHLDAVRFLVLHGAAVHSKDRFGNTALDDANRHGHKEVAKFLQAPPKAIYFPSDSEAKRCFGSMDLNGDGTVVTKDLLTALESVGLNEQMPHMKKLFRALRGNDKLDLAAFEKVFKEHHMLAAALGNSMIVPQWTQFSEIVKKLSNEARSDSGGKVADYIPELAKVDPNMYAVSICTVSSQQANFDDHDEPFCIQSMTKVINYLIALELHGPDKVHKFVGREPSGRNFNELVLDYQKKPHNPCINAGAIMTCSLILPEKDIADRFSHVSKTWEALIGESNVSFSNATYLSERQTADRNWTLAYMMKDAGAFEKGIDLQATLDLYFMTCSFMMTASQLAVAAATLAAGGVNPLTKKRVFSAANVRNCLAIMANCGMYDFSGEWNFRIGMPAKSGVGGGIIAVVPGVAGVCTWSPPLDKLGNSVRGISFYKAVGKTFNFHVLQKSNQRELIDPSKHSGVEQLRKISELIDAASSNNTVGIMAALSAGVSPSAADYDARTALHVAAAEGALDAVKLLLARGADKNAKDRWGNTPLQDAKTAKHSEIVTLLQ